MTHCIVRWHWFRSRWNHPCPPKLESCHEGISTWSQVFCCPRSGCIVRGDRSRCLRKQQQRESDSKYKDQIFTVCKHPRSKQNMHTRFPCGWMGIVHSVPTDIGVCFLLKGWTGGGGRWGDFRWNVSGRRNLLSTGFRVASHSKQALRALVLFTEVSPLISPPQTATMWIDWSQRALLLSLASITFNPTAWNIVARNGMCTPAYWGFRWHSTLLLWEYRNKSLTKLFGGNSRLACYFLAILIFSFGILRDSL